MECDFVLRVAESEFYLQQANAVRVDPQPDPQQETSGWKQWSGKHHCLRFSGTKMPPKHRMEAFRGWAISW